MRSLLSIAVFLGAFGLGVFSFYRFPVATDLETISANVSAFHGRRVVLTTYLNRDDSFSVGEPFTKREFFTYIDESEIPATLIELLHERPFGEEYARIPVAITGTVEDNCQTLTCCFGKTISINNAVIVPLSDRAEIIPHPLADEIRQRRTESQQ